MRRIRVFIKSEKGVVAVYVSILAALMIGMAGLALDASQFMTTNSEAKAATDAAALAAASQLDGSANAISRAISAAQSSPLVTNRQTFADGGPNVAITGIRFFSSLPADTVATIPSSYETTVPQDARFVEVTSQQLSRNNTFLPVLSASAQTSTTQARSVAGFTQVVCKFPPLMICNPFETASYHEFPVDSVRGDQLLAKSKQGGASAWAPGDFGLLDPPNDPLDPSSNSGAKHVAEQLAAAAPNACYGSQVSMRPGAVTPMKVGINVRFDMYDNPYMGSGSAKSDPQNRPARNVIKGMKPSGGSCSQAIAPGTQKMPEDTCLAAGTCATSLPTRLGDGVWDRNLYWSVNHPGVPLPAGLATASRYQVYRYEIDNGAIPNNTGSGGENGNPQCYSGSTAPNDNPDRRVLYMAVINCIEQGPLNGGSANNVTVKEFAKMFLTEPVSTDNVWLEFIDVVKPGQDNGVLHDQVQLYR